MIRRPSALAGLLCLGLLTACGDDRAGRVRIDADQYILAVQYRDARGLVKRLAPARAEINASPPEERPAVRDRWEGTVEGRFAAYDDAKTSGSLPFGEYGINLIQGLAIGKGIFYSFREVRVEAGGERAAGIMEVRPDYQEHRFQGLPAGTRVYFLGEPLNRLQTVVLGRGQERTLRVPGRVVLEWRLRWFEAVDVYPAGWAVESVRPHADGIEMIELTRVF